MAELSVDLGLQEEGKGGGKGGKARVCNDAKESALPPLPYKPEDCSFCGSLLQQLARIVSKRLPSTERTRLARMEQSGGKAVCVALST